MLFRSVPVDMAALAAQIDLGIWAFIVFGVLALTCLAIITVKALAS